MLVSKIDSCYWLLIIVVAIVMGQSLVGRGAG